MSAQTDIIAFDGAGTPISHTFTAAGVSQLDASGAMTAEYRELLAAAPVYAQPRVVLSKRKLKSGVYRLSVQVTVPVMESVSGQNAAGYTAAAKVAYENTASVVCYFHERATTTERRTARQLAINIANGIATSVTPVTTGNTTQLIDTNVFPS